MVDVRDIVNFLFSADDELARRADFLQWVCHEHQLPTLAKQLEWIAGLEMSAEAQLAMLDKSTGLISQGFETLVYGGMKSWCDARDLRLLAVQLDITNLRGLNEALPRELGTQFLAMVADLARKHLQQAIPEYPVWGVRGGGDEFTFLMPAREGDIAMVQAALAGMAAELDTVVRRCGLEYLSHHKHPRDAGWAGVSAGMAMAYAEGPFTDVRRALEIGIEADKYRRANAHAGEHGWFTEPRDMTSGMERREISAIIHETRRVAALPAPWLSSDAPVSPAPDSWWEEVIREGQATIMKGLLSRHHLAESIASHEGEELHYCMRVEIHNLASLNLMFGHNGANRFMSEILTALLGQLHIAADNTDRVTTFDYGDGVFIFESTHVPLAAIEDSLIKTAQWVRDVSEYSLGDWARSRDVELADEGKRLVSASLSTLRHSRGGLDGIGFSAAVEEAVHGRHIGEMLRSLGNKVRLQIQTGISVQPAEGEPVSMAVQPASQNLSWKEFVKPSRALAEMLLGESLEKVLQVQATLLAIHDAYLQAGLPLPDLHAIKNEAALAELRDAGPVKITPDMIERARQAIDPHGGQAVPKAVPRSFEIMEEFAFPLLGGGEAVLINNEQKSMLLIMQAAARICENTDRLEEHSVPPLTERQAVSKYGEMLDTKNPLFNSYNFIDTEANETTRGAQALMHCADMLLWAVMVARQKGKDFGEEQQPVLDSLHNSGVSLFNAVAEAVGRHFNKSIEMPVSRDTSLAVGDLLRPLQQMLLEMAGNEEPDFRKLMSERMQEAQCLFSPARQRLTA